MSAARLRFQLSKSLLTKALLANAVLCALFVAPATAQEEVHPFSIPNTRAASDLAALASQHISAKRWEDAVTTLQRILEVHGGALLDPSRPRVVFDDGSRSKPSQQNVFPGAAEWARAQLAQLPPEALDGYRQRFENRALAALDQARADYDQAALAELAERWPETGAAALAWWTLGDLEFEAGHIAAARFAWARALRVELRSPDLALATAGDWRRGLELFNMSRETIPAGLLNRIELSIDTFNPLSLWSLTTGGRDARSSEMRLTGPGEGALETPGVDASSWPRSFAMPSQPFRVLADMLWFPVISDDLVLFSTSRQLIAVNMWSGRKRWSSGEPQAWQDLRDGERKEYEQGLDTRDALFAPAAADGIVVAPLQVPYAPYRNENFDNIAILRIIPERRLFAWDLETGTELWNHDIPKDWDGESGSFAQRMCVAGPPVIAASRVIVPLYRLEGRISFHVACYDLSTGRQLWSRQLISGQRELNMFSRPGWAFSAPPVRIEGDRVICLTQLGSIASMDLFTGKLLWETLYEQIPLPPRRSFQAERRTATWRSTPPVVADGLVLATPVDSDELVAIHLETGTVLWSMSQRHAASSAGGYGTDIDLLLGADDETVYLGGRRLVALETPGGLRLGPPRTRWLFGESKVSEENSRARPVLTADRIILPTTTARLEIERKQGRLLSDTPWIAGQGGNVLAVNGALFTLNNRHLSGYFEWDVLLERARDEHRTTPESRESVRNLAALLAERGRNDLRAGYSESARSWLSESVELLTEFRARTTGEADAELLAELHLALRSYAEVQNDLADTSGALHSLEAARTLAPDRRALRDTLLQEVALLRKRDVTAWIAALDRLEEQCGDFQLRCAVNTRGSQDTPVSLTPLAPRENSRDREEWVLPVGLWTSLERADHYASTREVQLELVELHHMLSEWPTVRTPWGPVDEMADDLIGERLSVHGRGIYAPYDDAARELFNKALEQGDRHALEAVPQLYPFASASEEANDAMLALALEDGDAEAVARTVLSELPDMWDPAQATEREAHLALHLGVVLARRGNESYLRGLLGRLAISVPRTTSPFPEHRGRTIFELFNALDPEPVATPAPEPTFGAELRPQRVILGKYAYLGEFAQEPGTGTTRRLLFAREHKGRSSFLAIDAANPEQPLWDQAQPGYSGNSSWKNRVEFIAGRALVATDDTLRAYDAKTGSVLWTWRPDGGDIRNLSSARGLAFIVQTGPRSTRHLVAVDTTNGKTIWKRPLSSSLYQQLPIVGEDELVFLPNINRLKALVVDLYTGNTRMRIGFERKLHIPSFSASWIEDGLLIVPRFHNSREAELNHVFAIDLDSGRRAWQVSLEDVAGGGRELQRVLRYDGRTFLNLLDTHSAPEGRPAGILVELHTNLGATAELSGYRFDELARDLGTGEERVQLESPYWFQLTPEAGMYALHAVHLPFGHERWATQLRLPEDQLYDRQVHAPVLSDSTVALALVTRENGRGSDLRTMLYFFGRDDGTHRGSVVLAPYKRRRGELKLFGLGDALLVVGNGELKVMR